MKAKFPRRPITRTTLSDDLRRCLEKGYAFYTKYTKAELEAAWREHGDTITKEWITVMPGTRPFAAWLFELVPQHGERRTTEHWTAEHERHRQNWTTYGILHTLTIPALQEPEVDYLARHGLLRAQERRLLATEV